MNMQTGSGSRWGAIVPPKTYESNFIHIIFYNSENSIRDILPLFYQSSFVKCTSSILQWESRCALTTKDYWNLPPPSLTDWIRPCTQIGWVENTCIARLETAKWGTSFTNACHPL